MKIKKVLISLFFFSQSLFPQWLTSPYADSGLYVCPGFYPGLVTFEDGSSIVLGVLDSYIFAQKLDPYGYKVWDEPVLVHYNDSSQLSVAEERDWFCSDGDGGVIVFWQDHRGAYLECSEPLCYWRNNTTYIQRIDKNGNKRWGENGIKVNNLEDGLKRTRITSDGEGGCVLLYSEIGFDYPDAPNKNYLKIAKYNSEGERLWLTVLDSSLSIDGQFQIYNIERGGRYFYFNFLQYSSNYTKSLNENGELSSYKHFPISEFKAEGENLFMSDYTIFPTKSYKISKLNYEGDTTWTQIISFENFCSDRGGILIPDKRGGTYLTHTCNDSIIYFDSSGNISYKLFEGIDIGLYKFSDGFNGLLVTNELKVKRFDSSGLMIWQDEVVFLSDPGNAHFKYIKPDNNGGLIITYWSTIGGIFAQHTGRNGKLGVVTDIKDIANSIPIGFELFQNYPNPFNPTTTISYSLPHQSSVELVIYDIMGREVKSFNMNSQSAGTQNIIWNGTNENGSHISSGVYIYRIVLNSLETNEVFTKTAKMMLLK